MLLLSIRCKLLSPHLTHMRSFINIFAESPVTDATTTTATPTTTLAPEPTYIVTADLLEETLTEAELAEPNNGKVKNLEQRTVAAVSPDNCIGHFSHNSFTQQSQ